MGHLPIQTGERDLPVQAKSRTEPLGTLKRGSQTGHSGTLILQNLVEIQWQEQHLAKPREDGNAPQRDQSTEFSPWKSPASLSSDIFPVAPGRRCLSSLVRWLLNYLHKLGDSVDIMLSRWKYGVFLETILEL